jgi:hypothetical protein
LHQGRGLSSFGAFLRRINMPEKPEKPKKDLTFEQMYGRLDKVGEPEKVSGTPACRSERQYMESLNERS